eukprot:GHUV01034579.1.p1 GENE.GHUV01034579.1~~GHUV01034579.1.p1  ORF type:complete len:105 (-),score=14.88 GHUV01034579.1:499-813(-)
MTTATPVKSLLITTPISQAVAAEHLCAKCKPIIAPPRPTRSRESFQATCSENKQRTKRQVVLEAPRGSIASGPKLDAVTTTIHTRGSEQQFDLQPLAPSWCCKV